MSDELTTLALAERRAADAKARLSATVGELQARLDPKSIVREAAESIADGSGRAVRAGVDTVRAHPGKVAGAVALVAAFAARKQVAGLIARFGDKDETARPSARSRIKRAAPPRGRTKA